MRKSQLPKRPKPCRDLGVLAAPLGKQAVEDFLHRHQVTAHATAHKLWGAWEDTGDEGVLKSCEYWSANARALAYYRNILVPFKRPRDSQPV